MRALLAAALLLVLVLSAQAVPAAPLPSSAAAPPADACREAGANERTCRTAEVVIDGIAAHCRGVTQDEATCQQVDGKPIDPALVDAHLQTWTHRALDLQFHLGDGLPFADAVFVATHNSYNAAVYAPPSVAGSDPNQRYSLYDQLRMDMRGLELDLVDPTVGQSGPMLCHTVCSVNDRPLAEGLAEIGRWLDENPGEVIVIDVQNGLGSEELHDQAAAAFLDTLGERIFKRDEHAETCVPMPLDLTRDEVLDAGAQVVLFTSCGQGGAWASLVYSTAVRSQSRWDGGFEGFPACRTEAADRYASAFTRHWEDSTWLASMAGTPPRITPDVATEMTSCGLNMPSIDQLTPDDDRLPAFVWSWAEGQPAADAVDQCAVHGADGRFVAVDCQGQRRAVCLDDAGTWTVSATATEFELAAHACGDASLAVPRTGWQNAQLTAARAHVGEALWMGYAQDGAEWRAGG